MRNQMLGGIIERKVCCPTESEGRPLDITTVPPREEHQRRFSLVKVSLAAAPLCIVALLIVVFFDQTHTSDLLSRQFQSVISLLSTETSHSAARPDPGQALINSQLVEADHQQSGEINQPRNWILEAMSVTLRLLLASLLAAMLAFRPHKYTLVLRRNPYVAQTQILLAVVASALMMIVSDNAARAFGIFAAAALVRFRTNIRDPKEITVC